MVVLITSITQQQTEIRQVPDDRHLCSGAGNITGPPSGEHITAVLSDDAPDIYTHKQTALDTLDSTCTSSGATEGNHHAFSTKDSRYLANTALDAVPVLTSRIKWLKKVYIP